MRWTSIKEGTWQDDCRRYAELGYCFEVRDVERVINHQHFFLMLCGQHNYSWRILDDGQTVLLTPHKTSRQAENG